MLEGLLIAILFLIVILLSVYLYILTSGREFKIDGMSWSGDTLSAEVTDMEDRDLYMTLLYDQKDAAKDKNGNLIINVKGERKHTKVTWNVEVDLTASPNSTSVSASFSDLKGTSSIKTPSIPGFVKNIRMMFM